MNYPIPGNPQEIIALTKNPIDDELIATAIAGVVNVAQKEGQSLEELTQEVLAEDGLLQPEQRYWLKDILSEAWNLWKDNNIQG